MPRLPRLLAGPRPVLPAPVDRASEWWAGLPPRGRTAVVVLLAVALALGVAARVRAAEQRWGGAPVAALVAASDLPVGSDPAGHLRRVQLPPGALPPRALTAVAPGAVLALALPEGAVLTRAHLDPRGPAAGLPAGLRALPVPVEEGWAVAVGGWVDVWVLGAGDAPSRLVARSRPVLELRLEPTPTALVGLAVDEVRGATEGLALGRLLLAHAPPPHPRDAAGGRPGAGRGGAPSARQAPTSPSAEPTTGSSGHTGGRP